MSVGRLSFVSSLALLWLPLPRVAVGAWHCCALLWNSEWMMSLHTQPLESRFQHSGPQRPACRSPDHKLLSVCSMFDSLSCCTILEFLRAASLPDIDIKVLHSMVSGRSTLAILPQPTLVAAMPRLALLGCSWLESPAHRSARDTCSLRDGCFTSRPTSFKVTLLACCSFSL